MNGLERGLGALQHSFLPNKPSNHLCHLMNKVFKICVSPWIFIQIKNFFKLLALGIKPLTLGRQGQCSICLGYCPSILYHTKLSLVYVSGFTWAHISCYTSGLSLLLHLWDFSSSRPSSFQWKLEKNEAWALGEPQLYNSEAMPLTYSLCCHD